VERTVERRTFFVSIEDRDADTLLDVISRHVLPGSIMLTDMWRGYSGVEDRLGMNHFTANHSETFKDSDTGTHTITIEGT
jgi:hypothetical protein